MRTRGIIGMCMGALLACSDNGSGESAGSGTQATSTAGSGGEAGSAGSGGGSSVGSSGSAAGGSGGGASCTLTDSGPVTAGMDGQVIENLRIVSTSGPAIKVDGHAKVVIRNVQILHQGGPGISLTGGADDVIIEDVSIEHTGAPDSGKNPSDDLNNIECHGSSHPTIRRARLSRGSSGVYLVECPSSELSFLEGHDFRGPFPRGQLVQWNKSSDGVLEDFSVINPAGSWPEDNVNVYQSTNVEIRRGFIDGNNSPSGVGVIFDGGFSTGLVEDVDAVHMGNGCFSDYAGGPGVIFRRTRCRDNICTDQGRGLPSSNALMWCGNTMHSDLRIEESTHFNACNPGNIVWPADSFEVVQLNDADFTPRAPIELDFCWE